MHKLKNKHTGELITTPYMAEVEEYLNSGDYKMSDKPVYTKEMHERGELPPVGSDVLLIYIDGLDSCGSVPEKRTAVATVLYLSDENLIVKVDGKELHFVEHFSFKPITTIEDEMISILLKHYDNDGTDDDLIKKFLEKYNITPKES